MTRCDHGGKECPHTYSQAFYHPQFPAHPRNNDGSRVRDLILAVAGILLILALLTWANGSVPGVAAFLAGWL